MSAITNLSGRGQPIQGDDIDTDQIIPSRFLRWITFTGLERHIFEDARAERGHPLDDPRFRGAEILVVERNFGCGSSREHAPQGLRRAGFRAILGESFGEIFAGNCVSVGLVCAVIRREEREALTHMCEEEPGTAIRLDLENLRFEAGPLRGDLGIAEGRRRQFLGGNWDPLRLLLADPVRLATADAALPRTAPIGQEQAG